MLISHIILKLLHDLKFTSATAVEYSGTKVEDSAGLTVISILFANGTFLEANNM